MANVSIANSDSGLSGKTVDLLESDQTITGLKTFSRGAAAPFAVAAGATVVANLDADKLDGLDSLAFLLKAGGTMVGNLLFTDNTYDIGAAGATRPRDIITARNILIGGVLSVTGGQVTFPAAQAASTDPNTLDDYEEQSWTPSDGSGAALVLTVNAAAYIKIGKMVFASASVTYPATADGTAAKIGSLPFTVANIGTLFSCTMGDKTETTLAQMRVNPNALNISLQNSVAGAITNATMSSDTVTFTAIYQATA